MLGEYMRVTEVTFPCIARSIPKRGTVYSKGIFMVIVKMIKCFRFEVIYRFV